MNRIREILDYRLINFRNYDLAVYQLLETIGIFIGTVLLLWLLSIVLRRVWTRRRLDHGSQYAIFQLIRYVVWVIAIMVMLQTAGVQITVLLAGTAALLVGIGLGLREVVSDLVSGFILLLEGTIKVDDVIEVDKEVVRVRKIGLRTSKVLNRDDIMIILPNSRIANNKTINWSHNRFQARFRINVPVAYGSDIDRVIMALTDAAREHANCNKDLPVKARLIDFEESSLLFEVLFYSDTLFRIEQTKADIRANIVKRFRENGITIPFPQRDVHVHQVAATTTA